MRFLFTYLLLLAAVPMTAQVEYHVDRKADNMVKFISDAPVEDFEGVTKHIDGYLMHQSDGLTDGSKLYFEVDLRTMDTGIGLRNRHMREDYLHTDKYPFAKFTGRIVSANPAGGKTKVTVRGHMDIHGVKKSMKIHGTVSERSSSVRIATTFDVKLTDHKIEVPSFMFLKIDETMKLVLNFNLKKVKG